MEEDKPEEPTDEDCCHNDCNPCVYDIYAKQVEQWNRGKQIANHNTNMKLRKDLLSQTKFKPFKVIDIKMLTKNIVYFTFQAYVSGQINTNGLLPYEYGQHCVLLLGNYQQLLFTNNVMREYSIISHNVDNHNCSFKIVVKIYENGKMSQFLKYLKIDDVTYWRGPYGKFHYQTNSYRDLLIIAMGTGIAPIYTIIRKILNDENDETFIKLMYSVKNVNEIIFRDELCAMASYWNFKFSYYLSELPENNEITKRFSELFILQKINFNSIKENLKDAEDTLVVICGSKQFSDEMESFAFKCEISKDNIFIL